ncbi:DNA replication complex GINS [Lasiodiplodia theobromae]|uniref:DNA replication complex GINS n=1 Tax=Lasiodiplodia theobromae TaxID=45133 RepID=UPI0015C321B2|nr:DNA replication complex GINS [Lasiodiplodia theobromae]KAF4540264.1 DNA replication complex GINS [Lasiodiplodia theobromae]
MGASSGGASPVLLARINEKKQELANLKELQALSAGLADQMEVLEKKLSTLSDGTEAVAAVLSNWHNVLRAINMASMKIPNPKDAADQETTEEDKEEVPLPQTLVRIPTQHAAPLLQQASSANAAE